MLYTNSNIANVAFNYLQKLNIPVTETTLKNNLQDDPSYPSLYSLHRVFERFDIDNEAFQIDKEKLDELQPPFIAHLKNQSTGKDFVLVTDVLPNEIKYLAQGRKLNIVKRENFLIDWEGIVFIAKANSNSGK